MKNIITHQKLIEDSKYNAGIGVNAIFAVIGFCIILVTGFNYITNPITNNLITFLVLSCLFGVPFGCFVGLRHILLIFKMRKNIKNGNFKILIDEVRGKRSVHQHDRRDYLLISTKSYTEATEKSIRVKSMAKYDAAKRGQTCYLVFLPNSSSKINTPSLSYFGKDISLSLEMQRYVVNDVEQVLKY